MRLPICGCGRIMNCSKTGLSVLTHSEDGLEYQLWASDEYTCPSCGAKVAMISSTLPIAEHWMPSFERAKRNANTPDGRLKLMRAYYGAVPAHGADGSLLPATIAGVPIPPLEDRPVVSSVDTISDEPQTADTTAAPSGTPAS